MKATKKNLKKAFTLVELVVVIAVIAILAAVLIPTFSSVIKNANNSVDQQLVVQLNLISSTHHPLGNGNDEFEFADNIRRMLDEEGVNKDSLLTKNKDVIIVYNTQTKQFERKKLEDNKLVAFAADGELDTNDAYYPEEIFENYIIVSTEGNNLAEAIYALHNIPAGADNDYVQKAFNKIPGDLKTAVQKSLENAIIIDEGGNAVAIDFSGDPKVTTDFSDKTKVIFYEKEQTVTFSSELHENNPELITIVPNNVTITGDTSEMLFAGNTTAVQGDHKTCTIAQARGLADIDDTPDIDVGKDPCENGHDWDTEKERIVWTWEEDYTSATATFSCKNNPQHTNVVTATVTSDIKKATCEEGGETVYTATVELDGVKYTDTKTVEIGALGHQYVGEWTSDGEGNHYHKCERFEVCGNTSDSEECELKIEADNDNHWSHCETCGYKTEPVEHVWSEKGTSVSETAHKLTCTEEGCDVTKTINHDLEYESDGEENHIVNCNGCDYINEKAHTFVYEQEEEDEGFHSVSCEYCKYNDYEEHDNEGDDGECSKCGHKASTTEPAEDPYFKKITSTTELVSGAQYLIVYEGGNLAFDGSLENLDVEGNKIEVKITGTSTIAATEELAKSTFTIAESGSNYTILSASGYYIGHTGSNNTLNSSKTTAYTNTISIGLDGNAVITASDNYILRYNNAATNGTRFRYYKSGQQAIQLYMLVGDTTGGETGGGEEPAPTEYNVTFVYDDGATENLVVKTVDGKVAEPDNPTREGYTFLGWFNGEEEWNFEADVTEDITLTAKWQKNSTNTDPEEPSETKEATISYSGSTTNMTGNNDAAEVFGLDATIFDIYSEKTNSGQNHIGLNQNGQLRFYKNQTSTLHIKINDKYLIEKIEVTLTSNSPAKIGQLAVVVGGQKVTGTNGVYAINSTSVSVYNADVNDQIYVSSIKIFYKQVGDGDTTGGGETKEVATTIITQEELKLTTSYVTSDKTVEIDSINYTFIQFLKNGVDIQAKKDDAYIYNATEFSGRIVSIAVELSTNNTTTPNAATIKCTFGSSSNPTTNDVQKAKSEAVSNILEFKPADDTDFRFFKLAFNTNAWYIASITITYAGV